MNKDSGSARSVKNIKVLRSTGKDLDSHGTGNSSFGDISDLQKSPPTNSSTLVGGDSAPLDPDYYPQELFKSSVPSTYKSRKIFGVPNSDNLEEKLERRSVLNTQESPMVQMSTPDIDPQFDIDLFKERFDKFLKTYESEIEKVLKFKDLAKVKIKLTPLYSRSFSSPRVRIDLDSLVFLIRDYKETGSFEMSPVYDNILDMVKPKQKLDETSLSGSFVPHQAMKYKSDGSVDIPKTTMDNTNFDEAFSRGRPMESYKSFDETFNSKDGDGLIVGLVTIKKMKDKSISPIPASKFELCKKFSCDKFCLFSVGDYGNERGSKCDSVTSTLFKVSCSEIETENCPQTFIYTDEERELYQASLDSGSDETSAHNLVLAIRLSKKKKSIQ